MISTSDMEDDLSRTVRDILIKSMTTDPAIASQIIKSMINRSEASGLTLFHENTLSWVNFKHPATLDCFWGGLLTNQSEMQCLMGVFDLKTVRNALYVAEAVEERIEREGQK